MSVPTGHLVNKGEEKTLCGRPCEAGDTDTTEPTWKFCGSCCRIDNRIRQDWGTSGVDPKYRKQVRIVTL